jgi:hypothetical protein
MSKVYLTGVEISEGCFPDEKSVGVIDSYGKGHSGFFYDNMICDGGLEVRVWNIEGRLAVVEPIRGQEFLESRNIVVDVNRLRYS